MFAFPHPLLHGNAFILLVSFASGCDIVAKYIRVGARMGLAIWCIIKLGFTACLFCGKGTYLCDTEEDSATCLILKNST